MRKLFTIAALVLACVVSASAQKGVEADLMKMEKAAWDAFGKGDGKFFQSLLTEDAVVVGDAGFQSKADSVKMIGTKPCDIKSFNFTNFKVTMLNPSTALVTYSGTQEGTCGGQPVPAKTNASSIYVKRNGKWMAAFHQETPAM
jgi:hypothetical protein